MTHATTLGVPCALSRGDRSVAGRTDVRRDQWTIVLTTRAAFSIVGVVRDHSLRNLSLIVLMIGAATGVVSIATTSASAPLPWFFLAAMNVAYWGAWAALIPLAVRVATAIRSRVTHRGWALAAHGTAAAVFAMAHVTAVAITRVTLNAIVFDGVISLQRVMTVVRRTERFAIEWELTMYGAIAVCAYAISLQAEAQRREIELAQLQAGMAEAQLLSLQRQIQPHFLFNTLHAISALMRRDPATAETMIERLSQLLRTSFRSNAGAEVQLSEDLATLDDYIAIEQAQMRERLKVTFDIDADALDAAVPVLLMQPLVENAVRHGLQPRAQGGAVHVSVKRINQTLHIDIVDDGVGLSTKPGESGGVALANTQSRLAQLYGQHQSFHLAAQDGGGVRVSVRLPYRALPLSESAATTTRRRAS